MNTQKPGISLCDSAPVIKSSQVVTLVTYLEEFRKSSTNYGAVIINNLGDF